MLRFDELPFVHGTYDDDGEWLPCPQVLWVPDKTGWTRNQSLESRADAEESSIADSMERYHTCQRERRSQRRRGGDPTRKGPRLNCSPIACFFGWCRTCIRCISLPFPIHSSLPCRLSSRQHEQAMVEEFYIPTAMLPGSRDRAAGRRGVLSLAAKVRWAKLIVGLPCRREFLRRTPRAVALFFSMLFAVTSFTSARGKPTLDVWLRLRPLPITVRSCHVSLGW